MEIFDEFLGLGVDYDSFRSCPDFRRVRSFAVSHNLGNARHVDRRDARQCYAVWLRGDPHARATQLAWWFLIPDHGVAIELRDGTMGSWDGRVVPHCTLVASGVPDGDALYSLFMGVYARVEDAQDRAHEMRAALHAAAAERDLGLYVPVEEGETVWVRYFPSSDRSLWRRTTGDVVEACEDGSLCVRWAGGHGGMRGSVSYLCAAVVHDHVVRAGSIAAVDPIVSRDELVGRRVRVWWPDSDAVHAGKVTSFADGVHRVEYDDGNVTEWPLYWDSGAAGFVLE